MKNTERFSTRVDNYIKYRPHYPVAVIPYLEAETGLTRHTIVADIGAGTGISAQPFLDNGNKVYAVEPNKDMREAAEKLLNRYPNFIAVNGSAEHTTLPDASVDLIVAGTAFHWFDQQATAAEFRRIGRENAKVVLMWNVRQSELPFEKGYEKLLHQYGTDYKDMQHRNVGASQLAGFFQPGTMQEKVFQNAQLFDFAALKGRLLSSSYVPEQGHPSYTPMMRALEDLFGKYKEQGMVKFHYETKLYLGTV
ncbi:Methyltransferase domain-containing protein [Chitinophaga ginsengisegetis]|uniref:Methyltransferase domain-containing protein n=1 Tax=Chitinophaga ginsengisegetis TaxID=393003 RepID=A0A1T5PAC3_9BACT|nr:class I SAM-dependent methyltransferase [Chitinophaga ginsengisegetis]MDR6569885.1 SAM-dependent methyltransferase [Chitinophaga ginsengisegetis]MDR6649618.1 SAM-dependent methyltransferase [Chitinophaga ginsengisegetis]MDR6656179.1 SAM-dependent methyltransferase [Chitinophaga ginsengisegetis]SKD09674.1 Methyltransferase domain-containing protein [Chitinophaga ginsengisegetis]